MENLIVGNGINIQFGGADNTNESIILRAIKGCKENDFPKHIIVDDPDLILKMLGYLFLEVQTLLKDGYEQYAISSDEKEGLKNLRNRYTGYSSLKLSDVGFEDYYLIFDLFCYKNKIINPEKYHIREALKGLFLHSIYNKGKVNTIHHNYPSGLFEFFDGFDSIFTTNYDTNIEIFSGKKVFYLHGAFHIKKDVYNPDSWRNKLSDRPINECVIDDNYYYLYSNALTDYSGYSKKFSMSRGSNANSAIEKMAKGYTENEAIRRDIDSWNNDSNHHIKNLFEGIMLKINDPDLKVDETYPFEQFQEVNGSVSVLGLSPFNDTHIFDGINSNAKIDSVVYYYYDNAEKDIINNLLTNTDVRFIDVIELWNKYR